MKIECFFERIKEVKNPDQHSEQKSLLDVYVLPS